MKVITKTKHSVEIDGTELDLTHKPDSEIITAQRDGKIIVGFDAETGDKMRRI